MNKKTKLSITVISIMLILASMAYGAVVADSPRLQVSLISQEPDPAEPGEVIDLRFKVENDGGGVAEDILFEFVEEYPLSVYSGEAQQEIGSLYALQKGEEGIIVLYKIKVDEDAVEKTYYQDIKYNVNGQWRTVESFPIRVRTRDLVLSVESIETTPSEVAPGKESELSLTLRNNADSLIKDVKVNLDLSDDDTPFAPSTSISEKQIAQINSKTAKIMKFDIVALPDAEGGIYKVPIEITYTDETGTSYSKEDIISLKVSSTPDLLFTIDSSEINAKKKQGEVVVKITNRGLTNIKLLSASIEESEGFEIMSEPEVYVGNIDSDDYETVEYELKIKTYEKTIELPIEVNYRDSTNKQHKQSVNLELKTYSKGIVSTIISGIINVVIILAIIVGMVFAFKWFLKKRKKKKRQG